MAIRRRTNRKKVRLPCSDDFQALVKAGAAFNRMPLEKFTSILARDDDLKKSIGKKRFKKQDEEEWMPLL